MIYEELLTKTGLTPDQAKVYETLLKGGVMPASKAALQAGLKRGLGYKVIEQLVTMGLVEKIDKKVALFAPNHPSKIKEIIQRREDELKTIEASLSSTLGMMTSDYNLTTGKPNIQFFEGYAGAARVIDDSLTSKTPVLSYVDFESVMKYIPELNKEHLAKRIKLGIEKKTILLDSPKTRELIKGYDTTTTNIKLISHKAPPFQSVMYIYDNKISYITISDKDMIGVIIEDERITTMHRYLFDYLWEITPELKNQ
ncbi:MAG: helix-turn-helix domain-containing protein [bacterium]